MGLIEITLYASTGNRILEAVTPTAAERVQTAGTISVSATALALIIAGQGRVTT